jgi:hypothetical protein
MFHFEKYIMTDSSSESNREENTLKITWKIPIVSSDIGPDNKCKDIKLDRQVQEYYTVKQGINIFPMPHHPSYNSLIARTISFEKANWPENNPYPPHWLKLDFSITVS